MTDWKAVGIGALIIAILTIVLAIFLFPISFLGPIIGGFLTVYLTNNDIEETKDSVVYGAMAGVIGGLIIGILTILGLGAIGALIGILLAKIGFFIGAVGIIIGLFITIISIFVCGVLGAVGGVLGMVVREKGVEY